MPAVKLRSNFADIVTVIQARPVESARVGAAVLVATILALGAAMPSRASAAVGITLSTSPVMANLIPGQTSSTSALNLGVSLDLPSIAWDLYVAPSDVTATPGRMRAATSPECVGSTVALSQPLHIKTSKLLPTTTVYVADYALAAGTSPRLAHGVAADTLSVTYEQTVGSSEQLRKGCVYSVGVTWSVIGS